MRLSKAVCQGTEACYLWLAGGNGKVGDLIVTDSTALYTQGDPVPNGCGTCVEVPTVWKVEGIAANLKPDGQCGLAIKALGPGNLQITACGKTADTCVKKPERGTWKIN